LLFVGVGMIAQSNSHDERLPWLKGEFPPVAGNYEYLVSNGTGATLGEARSTAIDGFLINLGNLAGATFDSKTKEELRKNIEAGDKSSIHEESRTITNSFHIDRKNVTVSFIKVDEYYEYVNSTYHLWELYEVSKSGTFKPSIPKYTDQYGMSAAWRSAILPGWGQFHKGKTGKGVFFFSAELISVSSAIYCEMQRSDNYRKSQETTNLSVIKEYRNRVDKWELYRNIAIGAAAGTYIWNVLDAGLTKGKIRYAWLPDNFHLTTSSYNDVCYFGVGFNF